MPWNGSGNFNRDNGFRRGAALWDATDAAGRVIRTDDHDTHDEDLAEGLENCLTRDGQNSPTANLPMNSQRHTNVANAVADTDYAAWGQTKTQITSDVNTLRNELNPALATLADNATIAWDVGDNPVAQVTLGGNRTLANPTDPAAGAVYIINVGQDSTGGRTLAYGSMYDMGEDGAPILSSAANKVDMMSFLYAGGMMRLFGFMKGYN